MFSSEWMALKISVFRSGIEIFPVPVPCMSTSLCDDNTDLLHDVSDVAKSLQAVNTLMLKIDEIALQLLTERHEDVQIMPIAIRPATTDG